MKTGAVYVGSSETIETRWKSHQRELKAQRHCNGGLQEQWLWHGEKSFLWDVIEETEPSRLRIREQYWIEYFRSRREFGVLNIQGASADWFSVSFEKHQAYWEATPPRLGGIPLGQECHRCDGSGRAPSPHGHVRCSMCAGAGSRK